ncbi:MAG: hypothetical protein KDK45_21115, partial [Leptospiraceae bacterium]|nr:hypothetical protein [Leptospiraceae bacterium]
TLLSLSLASGHMHFSNSFKEFFTHNTLRFPTEFAKIIFLLFGSYIISILANDTRSYLGKLSESESRANHNNQLMEDIFEKVEDISGTLRAMVLNLEQSTASLQMNVLEQEEYLKQDEVEVFKIHKDGKEVTEITSAQLQLITNILHRVENSVASIQDIQKNSFEALKKAEKAWSSTMESKNFLEKTVQVVNEMKSQSEKIINISNTINEISDRTNLLSLNASIEAARAGEHGRGFSVVAYEVQKLADQSLGSSREISSIINATVKNIENASKMIQSTFDKLVLVGEITSENESFIRSLQQKITEQEKANFKIKNEIGNVTDISENIASLAKGQKGAMEEWKTRNEKKTEMGEETLHISSKLKELSHTLEIHANKLHELVRGREKFLTEENRTKHAGKS